MSLYLQALLVVLSFILVFVWQNSDFSKFSVPAIGFLVFMFLLVSFRKKKSMSLGGPLNFFILNCVLLLFIFTTGGIASNLFFILYFLLFGAAFIMDPRVVFIFPIGVAIVFWPQIFQGDTISNLIKVISLGLISPLAYFFGNQFKKGEQDTDEVLQTKERAKEAADNITEDVEDIIEDNKEKLTPEEVQKLDEILQEAQDLRDEKK